MIHLPDDLQERIAAYIDGELSPAEAARLEVFLANTDPALADQVIGMLADRHHLRALGRPAAPGDLSARIMEQIERATLLHDVEHIAPPRPWWQSRGLAAAAIALVIGGFGYVLLTAVVGPANKEWGRRAAPPGPVADARTRDREAGEFDRAASTVTNDPPAAMAAAAAEEVATLPDAGPQIAKGGPPAPSAVPAAPVTTGDAVAGPAITSARGVTPLSQPEPRASAADQGPPEQASAPQTAQAIDALGGTPPLGPTGGATSAPVDRQVASAGLDLDETQLQQLRSRTMPDGAAAQGPAAAGGFGGGGGAFGGGGGGGRGRGGRGGAGGGAGGARGGGAALAGNGPEADGAGTLRSLSATPATQPSAVQTLALLTRQPADGPLVLTFVVRDAQDQARLAAQLALLAANARGADAPYGQAAQAQTGGNYINNGGDAARGNGQNSQLPLANNNGWGNSEQLYKDQNNNIRMNNVQSPPPIAAASQRKEIGGDAPLRLQLKPDQLTQLATDFPLALIARGAVSYSFQVQGPPPATADAARRAELLKQIAASPASAAPPATGVSLRQNDDAAQAAPRPPASAPDTFDCVITIETAR
jgi:hypothetical protein